jgi:hypothetical protein
MEHNFDPKFRNRVFRRPVIINQFNDIDEPTLEEAANTKCAVDKNKSMCDGNIVPVNDVDQMIVFSMIPRDISRYCPSSRPHSGQHAGKSF